MTIYATENTQMDTIHFLKLSSKELYLGAMSTTQKHLQGIIK